MVLHKETVCLRLVEVSKRSRSIFESLHNKDHQVSSVWEVPKTSAMETPYPKPSGVYVQHMRCSGSLHRLVQ